MTAKGLGQVQIGIISKERKRDRDRNKYNTDTSRFRDLAYGRMVQFLQYY